MPEPPPASQLGSRAPDPKALAPRLRIRRATIADVERLAQINVETWRHAYAGIVADDYLSTFDEASARERWTTRLTDPPSHRACLVAELDDEVAAYGIAGRYRSQHDADPDENTSGWGEVYALYTHPDHQGRGAGAALALTLCDELAGRGLRTAALWVLRDNHRARRWYADRGWRADGTVSQWLGAGAPLEEVRMVRRLGVSSRLGR